MNWLVKIASGDNRLLNVMFKISNWLVKRQINKF